MKRKASAIWKGNGLEGKGTLDSPSGLFNQTPYSFKARFENEDGKLGTNPEELIAAAHAGCFAMALSFEIANAGFISDTLSVDATVSIEPSEGGFGIIGITLDLVGKVAGMAEAQFIELANSAKANCPISKALAAVPVSLKTRFEA